MEATFTLIEKTAFLKSVDVLSRVPTEALAEIAARTREIHCDPGDVLYREGDPYRGVFLVVTGTLELRKGRALIRLLGPGMSIGELWQAEGEPHQYTLVATEHSHVLHAPHEDVIDGMYDFPEFGVAMVQALGRRVHELNGRVLELERLVARLHAALTAAGVEPPDPRQAEDASRGEST
jgi:CRP-like cAMP-binding protein